MIHRRLADLVVACHALIVVFFLCGAFVSWQEEIGLGVLFGGVSLALHAVNFAQYRDAIAGLTG